MQGPWVSTFMGSSAVPVCALMYTLVCICVVYMYTCAHYVCRHGCVCVYYVCPFVSTYGCMCIESLNRGVCVCVCVPRVSVCGFVSYVCVLPVLVYGCALVRGYPGCSCLNVCVSFVRMCVCVCVRRHWCASFVSAHGRVAYTLCVCVGGVCVA